MASNRRRFEGGYIGIHVEVRDGNAVAPRGCQICLHFGVTAFIRAKASTYTISQGELSLHITPPSGSKMPSGVLFLSGDHLC